MAQLKRCTKCKEWKSRDRFSKNKSTADGLQYWCKDCFATWGEVYREENKDHISARGKACYERNKDHKAACSATYREENKDRIAAGLKAWYEENPGKASEYARNRRARKASAPGNGFTGAQFVVLCEAYDNCCLRCGRDGMKLTADHVVPLAKGGAHDISNIQPLCGHCNDSKGTKTIDYRPDW